MGSLRDDEGCSFSDAYEHIATMPGLNTGYIEISDPNSDYWFGNKLQYDLWICSPRSVRERRNKFFDWMENSVDGRISDGEVSRVWETSDAVLRTSTCEEEFYSSRSSLSCLSNYNFGSSKESYMQDNFMCREGNESNMQDNFICREGNEGGGAVRDADEVGLDRKTSEGCEINAQKMVAGLRFESPSMPLPLFPQLRKREVRKESKFQGMAKKVKKSWFGKLRSIACSAYKQGEYDRLMDDLPKARRVKVHQCRKKTKELSALYKGQDLQAHEGSILTMKFSPDGQYLASAGQDGVVRVWQVVEDQRCNDLDIPEIDPCCIYFTVNHLSELKPLFVDKEKVGKSRSLRKTSDSACVIFPPKVFRIVEKPLHEFRGHVGDILDLSWSKKNFLLSASVDKTVRMWRVGCDHCLRVFPHSNYVTCVQFNPVDDNYFISGSIDGKVRIWAISGCQVVDWTDVKDIVTAVCYRPDGQGGIVGSMSGSCCFYNMSDNHLQLDAHIRLNGKKKSYSSRITDLQFLQQDSNKIMVTCADSQVRILQGLNVICRYRGAFKNGSQTLASFTADGKHIISACEDANVYMWNCVTQDEQTVSQTKVIRSCERFSANASIAIPWCGMKHGNSENGSQFEVLNNLPEKVPLSSPSHFTLSHEYFMESFAKGSATWPEETLPPSSRLSASFPMHKSQHMFLKTSCQNSFNSHLWGLVIVTAGVDGRIRSFINYGLPVPV